MRKGEMKNQWQEEDIRQFLLESAGEEAIPDSLHPDKMKDWLRQQTKGKEEPMGTKRDRAEERPEEMQESRIEKGSMGTRECGTEEGLEGRQKDRRTEEPMENDVQKRPAGKHVKYIGWWCGTFAAAACLVLVLFVTARNMGGDTSRCGDALDMEEEAADDAAADDVAALDGTDAEEGGFQEGTTYAKLYQSFGKYWSEQEELYRMEVAESAMDADTAVNDAAAEDTTAGGESMDMDGAASDTLYPEGGANGTVLDKGGDGSDMSGSVDSGENIGQKEDDAKDYGKTNQQEEAVEEADIIKNDGRYLYRVVERQESDIEYSIRIVDTKDGLKEASMVGNFEIVQNIYV